MASKHDYTIATTGHDGTMNIIAQVRHIDIDEKETPTVGEIIIANVTPNR